MNDREQIIELYKTYWNYMINKDTDGLDAVMAEDYELVHMTGKSQGKESFFASLTCEKKMKYGSLFPAKPPLIK